MFTVRAYKQLRKWATVGKIDRDIWNFVIVEKFDINFCVNLMWYKHTKQALNYNDINIW